MFQPTCSDHSAFWFEDTSPTQWDGDVGRACEAAVADWQRFQKEAEAILEPVIPNLRVRHHLTMDLANRAFPEAFSPACQLWRQEEEALSIQTLHQPLEP